VFVEGLVSVVVKNREQAMNIINAGLQARNMAGTAMNESSSRSHTLLHVDLF
jgi:protein subunit release factor A